MRQFTRVAVVLITSLVCLSRVSSAQEADDANVKRADRVLETILKRQDKDGDGKIAKSEATGNLKNGFDRLDENGDDVLDGAELKHLSDRLRSGRAQRTNQRTAETPDDVTLKTDIAYREGNDKWRLDLAMPKGDGDELRPAIVFIHGGGWRSGDKAKGQWRSLPLSYAKDGYVCISINYRLTNEAAFPACVEDCKCAVRWLRAHAKQYRVDPKCVGGYGNSAGAHLVAMLGLAGSSTRLEGDGPYKDRSSMLQAVCCSATPSDFTIWGTRNGSASGALKGLFAGEAGASDERVKKASPVTHARKDAPPFLVIHGTADKTVPVTQGDGLVKALRASDQLNHLSFRSR